MGLRLGCNFQESRIMKTTPMAHQLEALRRMEGKENFALFCEQGTGKTWMALADAERLYSKGDIEGLFVVAPKGVDANWILDEVPTHLEAPNIARFYRAGSSQKRTRHLEQIFQPREDGEMPPLRVLAMNYDALNTNDGMKLAQRFLNAVPSMMMLDESRRIKNVKAVRSKRVISLRKMAVVRRIGTGTPIAGAPIDVFNQMEFLQSGLLGTTSYRAFVAEYADMIEDDSPLMRHIREKNPNAARFKPQIVARNPDGTPRWKNLEKLQALLAPHCYRVLKRDCLDLPEKIYQTRFFELSPKMRKIYDKLATELQFEHGDQILTVQRLSAQLKLQQVTSGFVYVERGEPVRIADEAKSRLELLREIIEDLDDGAQFIIFARFREEIRMICEMLNELGISHGQYHGGTNDNDREASKRGFQNGTLQGFIAQQGAGGIGLTLTAAKFVIYMSNTFDAEERRQSEDRAHRTGTKHNVTYIDLIALDTVDMDIVRSLKRKDAVSAAVLGDFSFPKS